ncbi:MAG: spore coat associated protein CotJA [Defluviitaleaceae bacterium]|nr:spore coat associated protein CotJA [Defluviitaleaceae bacterium]
MEEMYILHELTGESFHETETSQESAPAEVWHEPPVSEVPEPIMEPAHEPEEKDDLQAHAVSEPITEPTHEPDHEPPKHNLVFVPIEEPSPNWEMELAQAYVRAQPLEGIYPPEEGLRMGTAFPNLSQPYIGR